MIMVINRNCKASYDSRLGTTVKLRRLAMSIALVATYGLATITAQAASVEVEYVDARAFDVRDGYTQTDSAREFYLAALARYMAERVAPRLPAGARLNVRITRLDLGGDYEARGPEISNIRIVRDVAPARVSLAFTVIASDGTVAASGVRTMSSTGYPVNPRLEPGDPLRYVKALIDEWLDGDLPSRPPGARRAP